MWKRHAIYESRPHSVIVNLGGKIYQIQKIFAPNIVSQVRKISSHMMKFFFFTIVSEGEHQITSTPSTKGIYAHQTQEENIHFFLIHPSTSMMQGHAFKVILQKQVIHTTITALSGCQRKEASSLQ